MSARSIAPRLAARLVVISTLVLAALAAIAFATLQVQRHRELAAATATSADQLAEALALPLWNFQAPVIDRILESAMTADHIAGVIVRQPAVDAPGGVNVIARTRSEDWQAHVGMPPVRPGELRAERAILHDGHVVGTLTLIATPRWIQAWLRSALVLMLGAILLLDAVLVACLYALLRREVIAPLQAIGTYAERVTAATALDGAAPQRLHGELARLHTSIDAMVGMLRSQYAVLQDSEDLFRTAFESASVGVCLVASDGRFLRVNAALTAMIGYSAAELQARTFFDITHPDDRRIGAEFLAQAGTPSPRVQRFDKRYVHRDGHIVWVSVSTAVVEPGRGRARCFISYIQDTTERHHAEELRQRSQDLIAEAQQIAHLGSSEWDARTDQTTWSEQMYHITGWDPARPPPTLEERQRLYTPESWSRLLPSIERALATGDPYRIELEIMRPDGERRQVEARGTVMRDQDGHVVGLRGTLQDISERSRMERELRESERRFRLLIENASDIVTVVNRDAILRFVGPSVSRVLGYAVSDLLDRSVFAIIDPLDAARVHAAIEEALRDPARTVTVEYRIRHQDGSWRILESIGRSLPDQASDGFVVVNSRDVTGDRQAQALLRRHQEELESIVASRTQELRSAKDEAEKANRAKSAFLATMSHEIRTPMNAVLGYAQLLRRDRSLTPDQRVKVETILSSGDHLLALLTNVLEMSRIEAGRLELAQAPVDLRALLGRLEAMFRAMARDKGLTLVLAMAPDLPAMITGDEAKIRQVVINLLGNAVKFTAHGTVCLRAGASSALDGRTLIRIAVSDTGPGIAPADQERVFAAFVQSATGAHAGGAGLGLAICRQLAVLMGGSLTLESTPGSGSIFAFTFPAALAGATTVAHAGRHVVRLASPPPGPRVLVADDNASNREMLAELLESVGFQVQLVASGEQALAATAAWNPALVLMDAQMPGIGGIESIRRLRASLAPCRIILLTASGIAELRTQAMTVGADATLFRPIGQEDLLERIRDVLGLAFTYEDASGTEIPAPADPSVADNPAELAHLLNGLPSALRVDLRDAARAARIARIEELSTQAGILAPAAAAAIRRYASDFRLDALAAAIETTLATEPHT